MDVISTVASVNIKTSIFKLQNLSHVYVDFYAIKMSRTTITIPF